ncbi:MAG: hypothetical protein WC011_02640 [Candidatus Paceibacterota bacterium]
MEVNGSPTPEGFEWFALEMQALGFTKIGGKKIRQDFTRLDLQTRIRKIQGYETGFQYSNGTYAVKVWTTFLEKENKLRDKGTDAGWVIITKGDVLIYCAQYFTRKNKNFFVDMKEYARINKKKIDGNPLCPCKKCEREMEIHRKKGSRQYFWICINPEKHSKPEYLSWDYGLSEEDKKFLEIRRQNTASYKKKNQKAKEESGKEIPTPKATTRKVREVGRPDNLKK